MKTSPKRAPADGGLVKHALAYLATQQDVWAERRNAGSRLIRRSSDGVYRIHLGADSFVIVQPDFNVLSFRSNLVLRWEWNPGSTLFLVWQQNRHAEEVLGERVRMSDLLSTTRAGGDNFVSLKISYWLPLSSRR